MAKKDKVKTSVSLFSKIFAYPALAVNLVTGILLTVSAYCSLLPPVGEWPLLSLSGLAFPFLFVANLVFLILWLAFKRKFALMPLAFLLITAIPAFHYCPIRPGKRGTNPDLTLMSYNTLSFGTSAFRDFSSKNPVLQYSCSTGADIICFQEAVAAIVTERAAENSEIHKRYPYSAAERTSGLACLSKYPILSHRIVDFDGAKTNKCMILKILTDADTITVFNCHFQSNHLNPRDFEAAHQDDALEGGKRVLRKLLNSTSLRAKQAEIIAEMARNTTGPVIVAGDFNDSPLSYVHRLFDRHLTDCYAKAGTGIGHTYNKHYLFYRIDHVFCSGHFTPTKCRIDHGCGLSDHYPIITEFVCNSRH